ncbi:MAG: hypothetical protein WC859_01975 [Elusimicrobiota bacterium]
MSSSIETLSRSRIPYADEYYERLIYVRDALGRYRLRPNQSLAHVTINRLGYRGVDFRGSETALLLGDSVTFGVGASGDDARLSKFWEQASGAAIADASVRAYRVDQHYVQLPALLDTLPRLKKMIVWCGYADLLFWATTGGRVEGSFQMDVQYSGTPRWFRWLGSLLDKSPAATSSKGDVTALAAHMLRYLSAMRDLSSARGIGLLVLLQPFLRRAPEDSTFRAITNYYDTRTKAKCGMGWYEASERFVRELEAGTASRGMTLMDLQSWVTESDFLDQVHLRAEAHERLARRLPVP